MGTGAKFTAVPRTLLQSLGVPVERSAQSRLAGGGTAPVDIGWTMIRIQGQTFPTRVTFADENQPSLLGMVTLEEALLAVDPWDSNSSRWRRRDFSQRPGNLQTQEVKPESGLQSIGEHIHAFEQGRTPSNLNRYESSVDRKLREVSRQHPRKCTGQSTADSRNLEWVTPGHPLFKALRRHSFEQGRETMARGACFHSVEL